MINFPHVNEKCMEGLEGAIIIIARKCMISVSEWKRRSASVINVYLL